MTDLHDRLERLTVPERRPEFLDELRGRLQEEDRASARRWRRVAVCAAAIALGAAAAASVVAAVARGGGSTVDRTVSCATGDMGGTRGFGLDAVPVQRSFGYGSLGVTTDQGSTNLFVLDTRFKGFQLDGRSCHTTRAEVPLTRRGLPSTPSQSGRCIFLPARILVRVRVRLDASGKPRSALVAVRMIRKQRQRPLAFAKWSPKRARTWFSTACR
ncbi:MAG TPA: hypothetical protein VFJ77_06745 [Gaiellaceae bacterium]|nr:hypothetical protein [Gaiellaceae bacterium]